MVELPFLAGEQGRGPLLVALFLFAVTVVTLWGTWQGSLPRSEEAVIAVKAREMLSSGDLLTARFGGRPEPDTPPLALWPAALLFGLFGPSEFTARLPFVLFSIGAVAAVLLVGSELAGSREGEGNGPRREYGMGLLAAGILAGSPVFGRAATHLDLSVPLALFVSLALLGWRRLPERRLGYVLWGTGLAGGMLCAGSIAFYLVPAAAVAGCLDERRRILWKDWIFIAVTAVCVIVPGAWMATAAAASGGLRASPLWRPVFGLGELAAASFAAAARGTWRTWLGNLPWSVPATAAFFRTILLRRRKRDPSRIGTIDDTAAVFLVFLYLPLALTDQSSAGVHVAPFIALMAAREIGRWLSFDLEKVWAIGRGITAVFCLLMLLLFITPLRLHRFDHDPMEDISRMAEKMTPAGAEIGNIGLDPRRDGALLLFYGGRSLAEPAGSVEELVRALGETPGGYFICWADDLERIRASEALAQAPLIMYRSGNLVLAGLHE